MINFKLAQCDKDGKFEKYLELGGDYGNFSYFKSCFIKWHNNSQHRNHLHISIKQ